MIFQIKIIIYVYVSLVILDVIVRINLIFVKVIYVSKEGYVLSLVQMILNVIVYQVSLLNYFFILKQNLYN